MSFSWTVGNTNWPPVLNDPGAQASAEGETVALMLAATDPDGDTLTYGVTGLPAGLSLDASTGEIGGTLGYTVSGGSPYSVTVTVSDGAGGSDAATFVWTVADRTGISIWSDSATPQRIELGDTSAVELGVKFQSDVEGFITGLRFYKGAATSGAHIGNLWTNGGTPLASVSFTNETASGWQEVALPVPVAITANTTYVASYHAPQGQYAVDDPYFAAGAVTNAPLRALADGEDGPNGVYRYGASGFPTSTWNSSNYWVDVVFVTSLGGGTDTTPRLSDPGAQASAEGETVGLTLVASDPDGDSLTFGATGLPAGLSLDASTGEIGGTLGYTVSGGSPYSVTVTVSDGNGGTDAATFTWTVADRNGVPTLATPAAQSDAEGVTVALTLAATDPDGDSLTYGAAGLPAGLSLDPPTGEIGGRVDYSASENSPYSVTVAVSDGELSATTSFSWTVVKTNRPPALADPGAQASVEGRPWR